MKRELILAMSLLVLSATLQAKNEKPTITKIEINNFSNNVITFIEKGIEFHVFLNGEFNFKTNNNYNYNRRRTRIRVTRDYSGRINSVGNVSIFYDYNNNVKRIGHVGLKYRYNQLVKVGQLRISYRHGRPEFHGYVKNNYYNDTYGLQIDFTLSDVFDYNHPYFYNRNFGIYYSQIREDRNYYYYRANRGSKIGKQNKLIKRRKRKSNIYKNNSYSKRKSYTNNRHKKNVKKRIQKKKNSKHSNKRRG